MNAHVLPNGSVSVWSGAPPLSFDGWMVPIEVDEVPQAQPGKDVVVGNLDVEWTNGVPTRVIRRWAQVDKPATPRVPVTRLTIKRRVTAQEWAGISAAISQLAASEDPANRSIAEDWAMATEIDPNDPQTAAVISNLVGLGILTTQLDIIFAPPA